MDLKNLLESEVRFRNSLDELSLDKPDPLIVAKKYKDEFVSLACALFAYGNAKKIVEFLDRIDFKILDESENEIKKYFKNFYYRFQTKKDVIEFFITLKRLKQNYSIEDLVYNGFKKEFFIIEGINNLIKTIKSLNRFTSQGYNFLISNVAKPDKNNKISLTKNSPYKRYNMFIRWMVRCDNLDMGLWNKIDKKHLIIPLDTHTHKVSLKLGLINRKSYDLKAAIELTNSLKNFDKNDPVKYDFALYRIGQEKLF